MAEKSPKIDLIDVLQGKNDSLFNNGAQAFNHTFYWLCLTPEKKALSKESDLAKVIAKQFGSEENLKKEFIESAKSLFGSGWTWLSADRSTNELRISNQPNGQLVDLKKEMPLLVCDVWEHAYYIDHRNDRGKYLDAFWPAINWNFAEENLRLQNVNRIIELMC